MARTEQHTADFPGWQAEQVSSGFLLVGQGHLVAENKKSRVKPPQNKLQLPCNKGYVGSLNGMQLLPTRRQMLETKLLGY